ncbi:MAG: hypothetical protein C5B50_06410 [Verrucomicrobia bacterium]|nr:MAG: hypothetical protein C5B50_06410 [Verrucomicrobiota bacterium]
MARLIVNPGSTATWEIQLKPGANFIGRAAANDFTLEDSSVSGSHCQLLVEESCVVLKDLGSTNGTFINRTQIKEAVLQDGQNIQLGGVSMIFYADTQSRAGVPTAPIISAAPLPPASGPIRIATASSVPQPAATPPPIPASASSDTVRLARPPDQSRDREGAPTPSQPPVRVRLPTDQPTPPTASAKTADQTRPAERDEGAPTPSQPPVRVRLATTQPPQPAALASDTPVAMVAQPPSVSSPLAPPPLGAPERSAGGSPLASGPCKHHPKVPGRFFCNKCNQFFCEFCVTTRSSGGVAHKTCRHCGTELSSVMLPIQRPVEKGFFELLPAAFGYPLRGTGFIMLVVGILILAGLRVGLIMVGIGGFFSVNAILILVAGVIVLIYAGGYLFSYLQSIIHSTAAGDREMPELPGMNIVDTILLPFGRFVGIGLVCFGPGIGLLIWANHDRAIGEGFVWSGPSILGIAAILIGGLYFPMAFLSVAILDSIAAANPMLVMPSIVKVPGQYFIATFMLGAVVALRITTTIFLFFVFPKGWTTHSMGTLFAMIGAIVVVSLTTFYFLLVAVHVLGLVYASKKKELGWLDH